MTLPHDAQLERLDTWIAQHPHDFPVMRQLLNRLDVTQFPKGAFAALQDRVRSVTQDDWRHAFLSTPQYLAAYRDWMGVLREAHIGQAVAIAQLFLGHVDFSIDGQKSHCPKRLKFFEDTNAISALCHQCYKVQVLAKDLDTLVQVHFLMLELTLPADNPRKCMIEVRKNVALPYKGYIFCPSLENAQTCKAIFEQLLAQRAVRGVQVKLTHGCSEYGLQYPEFKYSEDAQAPAFKTPKDWAALEQTYFKGTEFQPATADVYDKSMPSLRDVFGFRTWVKYAELIGDPTSAKYTALGGPDLPDNFVRHVSLQAAHRNAELAQIETWA